MYICDFFHLDCKLIHILFLQQHVTVLEEEARDEDVVCFSIKECKNIMNLHEVDTSEMKNKQDFKEGVKSLITKGLSKKRGIYFFQ